MAGVPPLYYIAGIAIVVSRVRLLIQIWTRNLCPDFVAWFDDNAVFARALRNVHVNETKIIKGLLDRIFPLEHLQIHFAYLAIVLCTQLCTVYCDKHQRSSISGKWPPLAAVGILTWKTRQSLCACFYLPVTQFLKSVHHSLKWIYIVHYVDGVTHGDH